MAPDYRDTILVTGVGRSGTSWLGDLVNYKNEYRTLFEPIHRKKGVGVGDLFFTERYIREHERDEHLVKLMNDIFIGLYRSDFTEQFQHPDNPPYPILMKEIRINLILKWIYRQFPELRIVQIVRHPGAVIYSQMEHGWGKHINSPARILKQPELIADHLEPFVPLLRGVSSQFEDRLYMWCIALYVMLREFNPGEIHWVFYEDLMQNPQDELRRLFTYLGKPLDEAAITPLIKKPSKLTYNKATGQTSTVNNAAGWTTAFSRSQLTMLDEVLALFGLDALYDKATLQPDSRNLQRLLTEKPRIDEGLLPKYRMRGRVKSWVKMIRR